jgi:hypothetical protein
VNEKQSISPPKESKAAEDPSTCVPAPSRPLGNRRVEQQRPPLPYPSGTRPFLQFSWLRRGDKDNVKQTVIKDGFQNLETIEKSLPKEKWPQ